MTMRLKGTCVLVLGVFAFAVPAYAGNGNGNANGNGNGNQAGATAPGNSGNAPGQVKKEAPAAAETPTTTTTAVTTTTVATTTVAGPTVASGEGVKPSNTTAHETHAQAQSKDTKKYGNGQTAGQIAMKNGASGKTVLHGPGNSQPHKAAPCSGGHERDVHALKGKHGVSGCGGSTPDPVPTPTPKPKPGPPVHDGNPPVVVTPAGGKPATTPPVAPPTQPTPGEF